jgi:hypothetical protein
MKELLGISGMRAMATTTPSRLRSGHVRPRDCHFPQIVGQICVSKFVGKVIARPPHDKRELISAQLSLDAGRIANYQGARLRQLPNENRP